MTTREFLLTAWEPGVAVPALCGVALALYFAASRGRRLPGQALCFCAAIAVLFLALASPLAVLARGTLFSAHMGQHLLLLLVVPPLVLLGWPASRPPPARSERGVLSYVAPWLGGVGAMWAWHAPLLCNLAATNSAVRALQTVSLLALGGAFWWPIAAPRVSSRFEPFPAMIYLFAACVACSLLGILLTFAPVEVCNAYAHSGERWGLSPAADQQWGGLLMWVPACLIYGAAILAVFSRHLRGELSIVRRPEHE